MGNDLTLLLHHTLSDRQQRHRVQQAMMYGHDSRKMKSSRFMEIFNESNLDDVPRQDLYTLLCLFYETSDHNIRNSFNPGQYFSAEEIERFSKLSNSENITASPVISINQSEALTILPWKTMIELIAKEKARESSEHPCVFEVSKRSPSCAVKAKVQIKGGNYYSPLLWINIDANLWALDLCDGCVIIPAQEKHLQLMVDSAIYNIITNDSDWKTTLLKHEQLNHEVPTHVTNMPYEEIRQLVFRREHSQRSTYDRHIGG